MHAPLPNVASNVEPLHTGSHVLFDVNNRRFACPWVDDLVSMAAAVLSRSSIDSHMRRCVGVSACSFITFMTISLSSFAIAASSATCFSVIAPSFLHLLTADLLTPIFFPSVSPFGGVHIDIALSSNIFLAFMWNRS